MSYKLTREDGQALFAALSGKFDIYAPVRFPKQGRFSDTDVIKYAQISDFSQVVYDTKSTYPMKEVMSPIQQAVFYFTEDEFRASKGKTRPMLIFARPCDINAMEIQSKIYAGNGGYSDIYSTRMYEKARFILMDCCGGDDTCFCVSMGTNKTDNYSVAVKFDSEGGFSAKVTDEELKPYFENFGKTEFEPEFVEKNELSVTVPEIPDREVLNKLKQHPMWQEFNGRCISCGACTLACSTCTCFTTRDVVYGDNPEVGERRRVAASCQIDGFTDVAGGASYRPTAGDRMRYKMLHKFHDYKARFGDRHMCVGCGRCTHRCPEYISITHTLKKMSDAVAEIRAELGK